MQANKDVLPPNQTKTGGSTMQKRQADVLVQFMTGHNWLNRHSNLVNGGSDTDSEAFCRFCQYEIPETSEHLFAQCDHFAMDRREILGHDQIIPPFDFKLTKILAFLECTKIFELFDPIHQLAENLQQPTTDPQIQQ